MSLLRSVVLLSAAAALVSSSIFARENKRRNSDHSTQTDAPKKPILKRFVRITSRPPAAVAVRGARGGSLHCDVIGSPPPLVLWLKNDVPIAEYNQHLEEVSLSPTGVARLSSALFVEASASTDTYTCLALSGAKSDRAATRVYSVGYMPSLSERYRLSALVPRILTHTVVLVTSQGGVAALRCATRGGRGARGGRAGVTWHRANAEIRSGGSGGGRIEILSSGTLVIGNVSWADMGDYTCSVRGALGAAAATAFLYPAAPDLATAPAPAPAPH